MQTTGTILLNARGMNINGYDCFVNLSKNVYEFNSISRTPAIGTTATYDTNQTCPVPGKDQFFGVTSSGKLSPTCLYMKNWGYVMYFYFNSVTSSTTVSTLSAWIKVNPYHTTNPSSNAWSTGGPGLELLCHRNAHILIRGYRNEVSYLTGTTTNQISFTKDTSNWHHYLIESIGTRVLFFYDGTKIIDVNVTAPSYNQPFGISTWDKDVFVDDLVMVKDQALVTSNFTVPSTYILDSEYALDPNKVKYRRNIVAANVDKKLIIPDEDVLKQY